MAPQSDTPDGPGIGTLPAGPDGKPVVTQAQANAPGLAAASPDSSDAAPAQVAAGRVLEPGDKPEGDRVMLAPVPPLGSVTLPPLEDGGKGFVIEAGGTEVDAATAQRAQEAAVRAGFRLRQL